MNILGLSTFCDASAAIVSDGETLCAIEEERLNRVKHYEGMPWLAVRECLRFADMSLRDIDIIAVGWNPFLGWTTRVLETIKFASRMPGAFRRKISRGGGYLTGCGEMLRLRRSMASVLSEGDARQTVVFVDHHLAHAASAFLASPYERANVIVADGVGECATISFFKGCGSKLERLGQIRYPHSLGHVYASVTGFLGFKMTHDEGKVMALAAFGEDTYRGLFSDLVRLKGARRTIELDVGLLDYHAARHGVFSKRWLELTGMTPRRNEEPLSQRHENLAHSLQRRIEETVLYLLEAHFPDGPGKPLCAAGGLFLNSVLNGRITRDYTDELFVQPASGDNGVSVGAALYASSTMGRNQHRSPWTHVYFGGACTDGELSEALRNHSIPARKSHDVFCEMGDLIARGKVVGWYRGRMEFGPRALGNRSILASPSIPGMKDVVNSKVKHREAFRPFATSVLLEEANEYFLDVRESPFMLKVFRFKEKHRGRFPAISHVDSSCRIQTVTQQQNPEFYKLLVQIRKRTGHGMVLNTSMNVAGEPIVNTPSEAIALMRKTRVDVMALNDYVIRREEAAGDA